MKNIILATFFLLLSFVEFGSCQICYQCNQIGASPADPGLSNAVYQLTQRQPVNTQCANFPYHSSNGIQEINCQTLNYSMFGNPMGGIPFTGWGCMKQSYTVTLKNYGNGQTATVPATVRGCLPVQSGNPYSYKNCFSFSDGTNPYVRTVLSMLYFPQDNVGPIVGNDGGYSGNGGLGTWTTSGNTGEVCFCYGNYCNNAKIHSSSIILSVVSILLIFVIYWAKLV